MVPILGLKPPINTMLRIRHMIIRMMELMNTSWICKG